jgi:3-deoxy-D-manno-octulosonate 8-phosphate phosphatase (KDO 8-P phosphatase)
MDDPTSIERRASHIKLLLMDCDGVLTDGRIELLENGDEQKAFHVRDGHGIKLFARAGLRTGIISGRTSAGLERRSHELGMTYLYQNAKNKIEVFDRVLVDSQALTSECAFIGDDHTDIPIMHRVGFAVAVADAVTETKRVAHYITENRGGSGAVREVVEIILKARGVWDEVIQDYLNERSGDR